MIKGSINKLDINNRKTHAFLNFHIVVATTQSHSALNNTTFRGYTIPRNADIFANLYGVHMDQNIFPEPSKFRPSRFLDGEGKLVKTDLVIPFGLGTFTFY